MDQNDPRLNSRRGPEGLPEGGRIRRPTRSEEARLERLSAYLDGWTTDRERVAVEREIAEDEAARADLADLRLVRTALSSLGAPRAPRSFALLAPPIRRPVALFRRMEWATRGAAGVAALAFAFALVSGPGVSETVTSGVPSIASEERAAASAGAAADSAAPAPTSAKARETATQTFDLAPGGVGLGSASPQTDAIGTPPAGGAGGAVGATPAPPSPAPASAPAPSGTATPAAAGAPTATPALGPSTLLAPAPSATPQPATTAASPTPTATPTVEATRFTAPSPETAATGTATPPDAARAIAPAPTAAPSPTGSNASDAANPAQTPLPGTLPPPVASEESGDMSAAPALGVLALLLGLLAIIERAGTRTGRA